MDKKLPGIFKNTINNSINNNKKTFYTLEKNDPIIKEDRSILNEYIFNVPVEITTYDNVINTKIVSKIKDHILTNDNRVIKLNEIKTIKRKDL